MVSSKLQIGMDPMRGYYRAGLVLAALTLSGPAFAGNEKSIRTAKVFHMGAPLALNPVDQGNDAPEPENASGFRLLDLARDRVGEAMRESFGSVATGYASGSGLAYGDAGQAALSPYSDIPVP